MVHKLCVLCFSFERSLTSLASCGWSLLPIYLYIYIKYIKILVIWAPVMLYVSQFNSIKFHQVVIKCCPSPHYGEEENLPCVRIGYSIFFSTHQDSSSYSKLSSLGVYSKSRTATSGCFLTNKLASFTLLLLQTIPWEFYHSKWKI